jgi:ribonuclease BN (tRNA processing enzyme)
MSIPRTSLALSVFVTGFLPVTHSLTAQQSQVPPAASGTQVVLLGTGTPPADPDRSGPAAAIVVNGTPYLVDMGAGVVRRAKSAVADRGMNALEPTNLRVVFVTHLHSDHTVGYPDLILTPWVLGRRVPLEVYGPPGIKHMTEHVLEAYRADFSARSQHYEEKLYAVGSFPEGHGVNAHEIKPGVVYKDANVTVTAFATKHAMDSYGYRFETADRRIVISGDTNPTQATIDACNGCDVLIHEVLTHDWLLRRPDFVNYAAKFHTTTSQLAELATKAKPRLLILYHASIARRPVPTRNFIGSESRRLSPVAEASDRADCGSSSQRAVPTRGAVARQARLRRSNGSRSGRGSWPSYEVWPRGRSLRVPAETGLTV